MNNKHYLIDLKYHMARARATLDILNKIEDEPCEAKELEQYAGQRIYDWYETFKKHDSVYGDACVLIMDDGKLEQLYVDTMDSAYKSLRDDDKFVIALLEVGALIRVDE